MQPSNPTRPISQSHPKTMGLLDSQVTFNPQNPLNQAFVADQSSQLINPSLTTGYQQVYQATPTKNTALGTPISSISTSPNNNIGRPYYYLSPDQVSPITSDPKIAFQTLSPDQKAQVNMTVPNLTPSTTTITTTSFPAHIINTSPGSTPEKKVTFVDEQLINTYKPQQEISAQTVQKLLPNLFEPARIASEDQYDSGYANEGSQPLIDRLLDRPKLEGNVYSQTPTKSILKGVETSVGSSEKGGLQKTVVKTSAFEKTGSIFKPEDNKQPIKQPAQVITMANTTVEGKSPLSGEQVPEK